jgi:hypothetical protein
VPVNQQNLAEIEAMGAGLGYTLWPSRTIIAPPAVPYDPNAKSDVPDSEDSKKDDDQRRRLLARVGLR